MRRFAYTFFLVAGPLLVLLSPAVQAKQAAQASKSVSADRPEPQFVRQYCVTCHNERNKANVQGFTLDAVELDPTKPNEHPVVWEKVIKKMRAGLMPPAGARRPDAAVADRFVLSLESEIDRLAAKRPDPGRTEPFHRLNRTEYRNAVRDLLALDIDVNDLLPADPLGGGIANFDNIAASLRLSESLLDRYLTAANRVSRAAVGETPPPVILSFRVPEMWQDRQLDGMPLGSHGGSRLDYVFPVDAEYEFRISVSGSGEDLDFSIDGEQVAVFPTAVKPLGPATVGGKMGRPGGTFTKTVPVKAGTRTIIATFGKKRPAVFEEQDRLPNVGERGSLMAVESVQIKGPLAVAGPGDTPSRQKVFVCRPQTAAEEEPCARRILSTLARRAYRRPVTEADLTPLLRIYREGRADGGFEDAIKVGLQAVLASPFFLTRIEADPSNATAGSNYLLNNIELASRLSFFLWSSIPDDELLAVAAKGQLTDPVVLEKQTRRMLRDPRAEALTTNFAAQWLSLRLLDDTHPDDETFPHFDEAVRKSMAKELTMFVDSIGREDRSVVDLLDADYTFVDERLALHYGIPGITGSTFQRVKLAADSPRRGLLGKASILAAKSYPTRTSPVLRGVWILENILGTPPPPPPPGVPPLGEQKQGDGRVLSIREVLSKHRANPFCSNCHSMIDPPGFALEQFDAIGRWRKVDDGFAPIDTSGAMPDGSKFSNLQDFRAMLVGKPQQFVRTFAEKLMTFALGRGLNHADAPTVRQIVRDAGATNYRFSSVVVGLVKSPAFRMRKAAVPSTTVAAAAR